MITENQVKGLINAHNNNNDEEFRKIILQIANEEAKLEHHDFSRELKTLANSTKRGQSVLLDTIQKNLIIKKYEPKETFSDLIVSHDIHIRLRTILKEYNKSKKSKDYGLSHRRKLLFEGNKGTGRTYTASVIASELNLPLYVVQLDRLVQKYMGETQSKLRQIFNSIDTNEGVYLFDELDNFCIIDRNFLDEFMQFITQDFSNSIIIIITNNKKIIEEASLRTFDEILHFKMPTEEEIENIYRNKLSSFEEGFVASNQLIFQSQLLAHSEIVRVCDEVIKESVLNNQKISEARILSLVKARVSQF